MEKGKFIVLEGGEKVGKTTQLRHMREYLQSRNKPVVLTHEPGGGDPNIRAVLLNRKNSIAPEEELDLFCKDRARHIENTIRPALDKGAIVLCDRFEPSTIAYQGYGRGMDIIRIKKMSKNARGGLWPDIIILLDANPKAVLSREEATSRFDVETINFHNRVRKGFLAQARENPAEWRIVHAEQPIENVWRAVKKILDDSII